MFKNSIVRLGIFPFASNVKSSKPNSKTLSSCFSEEYFKDWFIVYMLFMRSNLRPAYNLQRKRYWSVVSSSKPQLHIGLIASLKLCWDLCSFKWLKFNLRRVTNFKLNIQYFFIYNKYNNNISFGLIKSRIVFLNFFEDSILRISSTNFSHSWMQ